MSNLRVAKALTMQVGHLRSYQSAGLTTLKRRHLLLQNYKCSVALVDGHCLLVFA